MPRLIGTTLKSNATILCADETECPVQSDVSFGLSPKRRLAPKPSVGIGVALPIPAKSKRIRKKCVVKIHPILPKPHQVTIKKRVLKCKPVLEKPHCSASETWTNYFDSTDPVDEPNIDDDDNQQNDEHLMALFRASSTIAHKQGSEVGPTKINKQHKQIHARISALLSQTRIKQHNKILAGEYLKTASHLLLPSNRPLFDQLIETLKEFDRSDETAELLYRDISHLLREYPNLEEDFIIFLKPHEAQRIGKYAQYCSRMNMQQFANKLQHHFGEQSQQVSKMLKTLHWLCEQPHVTWEQVESALAPLLRQPHLIESLLQCFPQAKPIQSLAGDFEEIDLDSPVCSDGFEVIHLMEDKSDVDAQCCCTSTQACPLHLKFIDGRVYVQHGKSLRPAKVTYVNRDQTKQTKHKNARKIKAAKPAPKLRPSNDS